MSEIALWLCDGEGDLSGGHGEYHVEVSVTDGLAKKVEQRVAAVVVHGLEQVEPLDEVVTAQQRPGSVPGPPNRARRRPGWRYRWSAPRLEIVPAKKDRLD
ncbi:hypothetical protein ACWIGW_40900 [Nocardia brasiliensis]